MNRRAAAICLSALAVLALAGCTVSPADDPASSSRPSASASAVPTGDQSVAAACALVQDTIDEANAEFASAATANPADVVAAMKAAAQKLSDAASRISNSEVAAVLPDLQAMFEKTADTMQSLVDGDVSKLDQLAAIGDEFQKTTARFQELCAPE
ncbi:hypothetical protein ACSBPH_13985 [Microbacterium sp. F51-2R]|jgi:hypothetical protein|uniref:hypothetical protein n=1 Tax=Microbacterium sp. F51-2R TaxID=3445777 RepID=UPI003FA06749